MTHRPRLTFSPSAWAKLLFLRDAGETEIGGFGISPPEGLLHVDDLVLIPQRTSVASVEFDDEAVADYFEEQVQVGRQPKEFARIWIHTHPGICPLPSPTDEMTFARVFGHCDWAVMFILARGGASYARLAWNRGLRAALKISVEVDFHSPFTGSDRAAWQQDYGRCVRPYATQWPADSLDRELEALWSDDPVHRLNERRFPLAEESHRHAD